MKKIIATLAIYGSLAILAVPAFTQAQTPSPAPAQGACSEEGKAALYTDFTTFRTTDPVKANEAARKYLACSPQEDQYTAYLKKWSAAYDKEARKIRFQPLLYGDKKYAEAFALGKEILADEPENLRVIIDLGYSGFHLAAPATKNESFNTDSLTYARKAIQMIESGKVPESLDGKNTAWAPFKGKDDTLAYLYHAVGRLLLKTNPTEALTALIKAVQYDTDLKKAPWEYYFIAAAYETGPYPKMSADYEAKFKDKPESPEQKLALANIEQVIDRMIDAYARAVALAGNNPTYAANKKEWMDALSTWYKYRHNQSDTGLNEMIASVLSKPLPPEPTPLTSLPAGAQTTNTPATGSVSSSGPTTGATVPAATTKAPSTTTAAPVVTPKATTTTGAATGTPVGSTAKPANTATKTKPKTRNNHRGH
jgi:hypothetical protein